MITLWIIWYLFIVGLSVSGAAFWYLAVTDPTNRAMAAFLAVACTIGFAVSLEATITGRVG